ncbi:protein-disulfide reductase DsbD domain-containing protein [Palleronia abyssalis]|uniref:Thiol:disulfide interchange protein DsbD N-terminal domain-containing protein n=1 Tax=Palleronia abyssalis TaxID=1501240 RepID=A0A2R8BT30_9RHOB|nr:protein-disulfide reductase DsbD domain-containing protein [Palleronia abyssalis]SPJ23290.1 hypothetical protein PAA8504_01100 [Palleronia abyssalis]
MRQTLALIALLCSATAALSQQGVDDLRLLPGWRMENGRHMAALEIRLDPGWKTYWRHPGDAGIPPTFDWSGSENVEAVRIHWPAPEVFWQSGMRSVGYRDGVVLPIEITPRHTGRPVDLKLAIDMGVCDDICVPVSARSEIALSANHVRPDARIRFALANRPLTGSEAELSGVACDIRLTPKGAELTATLSMPSLGEGEDVVFESGDPNLRLSDTYARREGAKLLASVSIAPPRGQPLMVDRSALRMTVVGSRGAAEIVGCD